MPSRVSQLTRTSKTRVVYRTIAPNFALLPVTGELKTLINEQAVVQSLKNLIGTYPTERFYQLDIGSTVNKQGLFDFVDEFGSDRIKASILDTIRNYEPRAQDPNVKVTAFSQDNYYNVDITFTIGTLPNQAFSVPTIVIRAR